MKISLFLNAELEVKIARAALLTLREKLCVVETALAVDIHNTAKYLLAQLPPEDDSDCVLRLTLDELNVLDNAVNCLYEIVARTHARGTPKGFGGFFKRGNPAPVPSTEGTSATDWLANEPPHRAGSLLNCTDSIQAEQITFLHRKIAKKIEALIYSQTSTFFN